MESHRQQPRISRLLGMRHRLRRERLCLFAKRGRARGRKERVLQSNRGEKRERLRALLLRVAARRRVDRRKRRLLRLDRTSELEQSPPGVEERLRHPALETRAMAKGQALLRQSKRFLGVPTHDREVGEVAERHRFGRNVLPLAIEAEALAEPRVRFVHAPERGRQQPEVRVHARERLIQPKLLAERATLVEEGMRLLELAEKDQGRREVVERHREAAPVGLPAAHLDRFGEHLPRLRQLTLPEEQLPQMIEIESHAGGVVDRSPERERVLDAPERRRRVALIAVDRAQVLERLGANRARLVALGEAARGGERGTKPGQRLLGPSLPQADRGQRVLTRRELQPISRRFQPPLRPGEEPLRALQIARLKLDQPERAEELALLRRKDGGGR